MKPKGSQDRDRTHVHLAISLVKLFLFCKNKGWDPKAWVFKKRENTLLSTPFIDKDLQFNSNVC